MKSIQSMKHMFIACTLVCLLPGNQLASAQDTGLAEDPFAIELDVGKQDKKQEWRGRSPQQLRSWAKKNLHVKLTARKVIDDKRHPEWDWFRESGLGLFIHWGLPSANPDTGDAWAVMWSERKEKLGRYMEPATKMFSVADTWNPEKYDPEKWMAAAKKAGFGYSVLTTRHHDGYALWPSQHGTWDTGDYMGGRDLVKSYVEACRNHDIRVGFYYSGPNWHFAHEHKEFEFPRTDKHTINYKHEQVSEIPELSKEIKAAEAAQSKGQVRELMTNYGSVDVVWWDGNVAMKEAELQAIQPNVFVARGNIATPEGLHMGSDENVKLVNEAGWWWEQCVKSENSFTPNWHYGVECETNHWDTNTLLSELVRVRSLGGNLLVNIPPRGNGEMMEWFYETCDEMSDWMKHSRQAVHDVDLGAPLPTLDKTKNYTTKRGNIYYSLPNEKNTIIINGVERPESVTLLRTGESLDFDYLKTSIKIVVPSSMVTSLPDMVKIVFPMQ